MTTAPEEQTAHPPGPGHGRSYWRIAPAILAVGLLAAHFLRAGDTGAAVACMATTALLVSRRRWVAWVIVSLLGVGVIVWGHTLFELVELRRAVNAPWGRLAMILGAVMALTGLAALPLVSRKARGHFHRSAETAWPSVAVFVLVVATLWTIWRVAPFPLLLLDRFVPGAGGVEVLLLASYGAWLAERLADPRKAPRWRRRIWMLFSVLFFAQLVTGLAGVQACLQTGRLHVPVPAIIVGGPLFRGEGFFMAGLLAFTLLVVGPAWCSHLCYIGAWDQAAALKRARPTHRSKPLGWLRIVTLGVVAGGALTLRALGLPGIYAAALGGLFGIVGVVIMAVESRRTGVMVHCTHWCPIGFVATTVGRLNPFRLRIGDGCTACGACALACRYDALRPEHIDARRPGSNCTLCGDCVGLCGRQQLEYRFWGLGAPAARSLFIVLVVWLHACFLGVARM